MAVIVTHVHRLGVALSGAIAEESAKDQTRPDVDGQAEEGNWDGAEIIYFLGRD